MNKAAYPMEDDELVAKPALTPPPVKNWKVGEYKPDRAMLYALARAREAQPPMRALAASPTDGMKRDWDK